jgi:hypothetical protein
VLYDYETESLWFNITGRPGLTCVSGTYADSTLTAIPASVESWAAWVNKHPDSKYMIYRP